MAKNSLFGILLRKPWWLSLGIAVVMGLLAAALLPDDYRAAGSVSGLPFVVVAALAAWRQRGQPSALRIEQTDAAARAMAWPAFAALLEQAFARDGHSVRRAQGAAFDFVLERQGRRMLVSARRWKSAHTGLDALRALQTAREAEEGLPTDALYVGLGVLTDTARPFATEHRIAVWQIAELAQALRGLDLPNGGGAKAKA